MTGNLNSDDLRVIHGEIERLEHTVQGLLDFARLPEADRRSCDVAEVVRAALDLVRVRATQQGVTVEFKHPTALVSTAVDRNQIHTVLVNLFLNALDAMPKGGRLLVELREDVNRLCDCHGDAETEYFLAKPGLIVGRIRRNATLKATGESFNFLVTEWITVVEGLVRDVEVFYFENAPLVAAAAIEEAAPAGSVSASEVR